MADNKPAEFTNPDVKAGYEALVPDIKIVRTGYHGLLSGITPDIAKQMLAKGSSGYIKEKTAAKAPAVKA
jgi:hypothetical protein